MCWIRLTFHARQVVKGLLKTTTGGGTSDISTSDDRHVRSLEFQAFSAAFDDVSQSAVLSMSAAATAWLMMLGCDFTIETLERSEHR